MRRPESLSVLVFFMGFLAFPHFELVQAQEAVGRTPVVRDHRDGKVLKGAPPIVSGKPMLKVLKVPPHPYQDLKVGIMALGLVPQPVPPDVIEITNKSVAVDDWLARSAPKLRIKTEEPKDTTAVFADDLEFAGVSVDEPDFKGIIPNTYSFEGDTTPKNIILIADSIHLSKRVFFNLLAKNTSKGGAVAARSGGNLIIITRRFSCEEPELLIFMSDGLRGNQTFKAGGNGGSLVLVTEEEEAGKHTGRSCVKTLTRGGAGFTPSDHSGLDGEVRNVTGFSDLDEIAIGGFRIDGTSILSDWAQNLLTRIRYNIQVAVNNNKMSQATALYRRMKELDNLPVSLGHMEKLGELKTQIRDAFEKASPLWVEQLSIQDGEGNTRQVNLVLEVREGRVYLAPTELLIEVIQSDAKARPALGFLAVDPSRPKEIVVSFDAKLTVDPLLEQTFKKELERKKETYGGVFTKWKLHPLSMDELGVKDSKLKVTGMNLHAELTLDAEKAGLVLHRLTNTGLPFTSDWEYPHDSKVIKGTWDGPMLLFTRRNTNPLGIVGNVVTNRSSMAVAIEYAMFSVPGSPDQYYPYEDARVVMPGKSVDLDLPPGIDRASVNLKVPPEAIEYRENVDPLKDFEVPNANIIETIKVSNNLSHDNTLGGALEFVEITMTYASDQDSNDPGITRGPYRLASRGATGSEIEVSFIKPLKGNRRIKISGIAFYEGDSHQTLKEKFFPDRIIKITKDMLPPPG